MENSTVNPIGEFYSEPSCVLKSHIAFLHNLMLWRPKPNLYAEQMGPYLAEREKMLQNRLVKYYYLWI